jgi:predicted PilT family ATPase
MSYSGQILYEYYTTGGHSAFVPIKLMTAKWRTKTRERHFNKQITATIMATTVKIAMTNVVNVRIKATQQSCEYLQREEAPKACLNSV